MLALEEWSISGNDIEPEILRTYRDANAARDARQSSLRILDIGAGAGRDLRYIRHGFTGVDLEVVAVEPNQQYWVSIQRELQRWQLRGEVVGHLERTEGCFDVAVLQHVLCSVEAPEELLLQARQRLRPGGLLLFVEHMPPRFRGARWILRPLMKLCSCDLNVDAAELLSSLSWQALNFVRFQLFICGVEVPHIRGIAVKASRPTNDFDFL